MKVTIDGDAKEIADLVLALQGQRKELDAIKGVLLELGVDPIVLRRS